MSSEKNRRSFARVGLASQIRVIFRGVAERRKLLLENLSEGGLFIHVDDPKPIGTKLEFEFAVSDGGESIWGSGIVRWVETDPKKAKGMGIKFVHLNEEGRQELTKLLLHQRSKKDSKGKP